jgi:hypothetical protein
MNFAEQSLPVAHDSEDAYGQIRFVEERRAASRRLATAVWFPLLIGGIANLAAPTVVGLIGGDAAPAWYWGIAGPLIGISCGVFYASRPIHLPARVAISSAGIAVAIVVAALLLGFSLGESQAGAPVLAVAVGLGAFAVLYRSLLVGLVSGATLTAAIALMVVNTNRAEQIAYLSIGIVGCAAAIGALSMMRPEPHQE